METEEILNIEYKLTNEEGTAKITISDIDLTTIDYETAEIASISKEITVAAEQSGNNPGGNNPEDDKQEDKLPTDNKDDKEKPSKLPETGVANYIIISVIMILVAFISYKKYKQYKNI